MKKTLTWIVLVVATLVALHFAVQQFDLLAALKRLHGG